MSSVMGNCVQYSLFGESHGPSIGMTIHNLPSGITIDCDLIKKNLLKRSTGGAFASKRSEPDEVIWLSGLIEKTTTGAPLTFIIKNKDHKSEDYHAITNIVRPSHADYSAYIKYNGYNDKRGGGIFSGRLTACYVVAGTIARQLLTEDNIFIQASISRLGKLSLPIDAHSHCDKSWLASLNAPWKGMVQTYLSEIQSEGDSIGGDVRLIIDGVNSGIGEPHFYSVESVMSSWLFAIPGLKAVQFGTGVELSKFKGSSANDVPYYRGNEVHFKTNHNGGVLGGITNGMPIVVTCTFKPTSSIYKVQQSIDLKTQSETTLEIQGRHDPAFVIRTPIVVESVVAMALYDLIRMSLR